MSLAKPSPKSARSRNPRLRSPQTVPTRVRINEKCRDLLVTQIPSQPDFVECSPYSWACQ
jgi:hypothetical protein